MSALSTQIESDRIKEAVGTIGKYLTSEESRVWIQKADVECVACNAVEYYSSLGSEELVQKLAKEGWSVQNTDTLICPRCTGHNPGFWE